MKNMLYLFCLVFSITACSDAGSNQNESLIQSVTQKKIRVLIHTKNTDMTAHFDSASPYGGEGVRAVSDANGDISINLEAGPHSVVFSKMTSSHSFYVSPSPYDLLVEANGKNEFSYRIITSEPIVKACVNIGLGKALYISGASEELGEWKSAQKMTWDGNCWVYKAYMPVDVDFKIVRGWYVDAASVSAENYVDWEEGANHHIASSWLYQTNEVSPVFNDETSKLNSYPATLRFEKDGRIDAIGAPIIAGETFFVNFDFLRLPKCRASYTFAPAWNIETYVKFLPSGLVLTKSAVAFENVQGHTFDRPHRADVPFVAPAGTKSIEVWFRNWSAMSYPCEDFDSRDGANYEFFLAK